MKWIEPARNEQLYEKEANMKAQILIPRIGCLFVVFALLFAGWGYGRGAETGKYPSRPITIIYPFSAGGSTDLALRLIAKEAEKTLGQPIVVLNKPGGEDRLGLPP